jgi:hypothetical protein
LGTGIVVVVITVLGAGACRIGGSDGVGCTSTADGVGNGLNVVGVGKGLNVVGVGNGVGIGVGCGVGIGVGCGVGNGVDGALVSDDGVVVSDGDVVSDGVLVDVDVSDPGATTAGRSGNVGAGASGGTVALASWLSTLTVSSCH